MSTLVTSNISDGTTSVGTGYVVNGSAKAWVNLNGTGTIAIRNSTNIASMVDLGTGYYRANFSNAFDAADNYVTTTATSQFSPYPIAQVYEQGTAATYVLLNSCQPGTADYDSPKVLASMHGDLA